MNEIIMPTGFLIFVGLFLFSQHQVKVAQKNCDDALEGWRVALNGWEESRKVCVKVVDEIVKLQMEINKKNL